MTRRRATAAASLRRATAAAFLGRATAAAFLRRATAAASVAFLLPLVLPSAAAGAAGAAESWTQTSSQSFHLLDALQRSQGVATDGDDWYFSWQYGLSRVSLDGTTTEKANALAIPWPIALEGGNHIGALDFHGGKLYAPIEDGDAYRHPYVAVYDAASLAYTGTAFALPQEIQRDGVPWVAVDAERGRFLSSEYDATAINAYGLADGRLIERIPLSEPVRHLQGAKVHGGSLYASSDAGAKGVYKIDLASGAVARVLDPGVPDGTELEGLAFLPRPDGSLLHLLDVAPNRVTVEFRHYRR
ncbi:MULTISPECIES: hypothetical protein [Actinomadura]|uniref:Uncharacterized protein n=1 Tax=Actinomadura yumaensis TaxID=111807 RepID=A0ABW2CZV2_9ACTN|nr:hypothetical protein [Actinomadura sp. J1-007]MWK39419.1 hypothetical protein [Actinomadura sp. J1-007]